MGTPQTNFKFPNMRILDTSYNGFIGELPLRLFENWKAKKIEYVHQIKYIQVFELKGRSFDFELPTIYTYSIRSTKRSKNYSLSLIAQATNLSEIPKSIGKLKGAKLLYLSYNNFTSNIPSHLGNLTKLEAFELSQNKLSGEQDFTAINTTYFL